MNEKADNLVALSELADVFGYTRDHLAYLCRKGEVAGQKIGRSWYSSHEAVAAYQREIEAVQSERWAEMSRNQSLENFQFPISDFQSEKSVIPDSIRDPGGLDSSSEAGMTNGRDDKRVSFQPVESMEFYHPSLHPSPST